MDYHRTGEHNLCPPTIHLAHQEAHVISIVLGFDTALAYWSSPLARSLAVVLDAQQAAEALASSQKRVHDSLLASVQHMQPFRHLPASFDILVRTDSERRQTHRANFRCVSGSIPDGALAELSGLRLYSNGELCRVLVSTPEFCFVQMARYLNEIELMELGFELCGTYAIYPPGRNGLGKRPALTTPEQLESFANKCSGLSCVNRARNAARRVVANSRSPKESQLTLLATLPRRLGGFALPRPLLNESQPVDPHVARVLEAPYITPDLYWPDINTVIEYDSDTDHSDESSRMVDSRKRNAYDLLGIRHISLTYEQFKDLGTVSSILEDISRRFGIKRRPMNADQLIKREELHRQLLYGTRRARRFINPEDGFEQLYDAPKVLVPADFYPEP